MKVRFDGLRRPARVAKILRAELAAAGIKVGLAKAQDIAARGYGYASYRELQTLAGRSPASQWDEDCPAPVSDARRDRQATALVEAGMAPAAAAAAVERVRPSGRTLGPSAEKVGAASPARRGGKGSVGTPPEGNAFLELVARAAEAGSTRVVATVREQGTVVNMTVDGRERLLAAMRREDGMRLCEAAFALAGVPAGAYDPLSHRGERIAGAPGLLPSTLHSLVIQSNPLAGGGVALVLGLRYASPSTSPDDGIETLGFAPAQVGVLRRMGRRPFGVNVVAGPLGAGKATTLRRMAEVSQDGRGAITVSDGPDDRPPADAGTRREAFRRAIGSALRTDPELVLIGELADDDTVSLAWTAAATGHAVWTTVVAPDAMRALDTIRGMGLPDHRLGDATLTAGIVAQRRIRGLCPHCSMTGRDAMRSGRISPLAFTGHAEAWGDGVRYARAGGCDACEDGMAGRVLVAETLVPDEEFLRLYVEGRRQEAMDRWLDRPGGHCLADHAVSLVARGVLDPIEAERRIGSLAVASRERVAALVGSGLVAA